MNIYYVNRYSKYKGPFDIIDSNRERIIKVGDICLRDSLDCVAFLVVRSSENSWNACKRIGIGNNRVLSGLGNTLLFSFDGLHRRKGNAELIKKLIDCYREKVIIDFFNNAIEILEYKKDFWEVSLFRQFFASSQELITRSEVIRPIVIQNTRRYPSVFAEYLDEELFELLKASINDGYGLKEAYTILREKNPILFRTALMRFLAENPTGTIYDKPSVSEIPTKSEVEQVAETQLPIQEKPKGNGIDADEDQSYLLSDFSSEEFKKLLNRYRKGDKKALEQIVKKNQKLVAGIARQYKDHGVEYDDLIQEGTIGLIRAIERFNPNRNVSFPFYAQWWINQALVKALIAMQSIVKIPPKQISLYKKLRKSIERYEQENGYEPSVSEIDIEGDVDPEDIAFLSSLPDGLHKITTNSNDWDEYPSSDFAADESLIKESQIQYIIILLNKLKKREAEILRKIYGIGQKSESLSDIGEHMGLTRERVRQIGAKAIKKIRDLLTLQKTDSDDEDSPVQAQDKNGNTVIESSSKPSTTRKKQEKKSVSNTSYRKSDNQQEPRFHSSTLLQELVELRLITRKQLKHCKKRNLKTIGDVEQIIEKYRLTPDSTRFTKYTLDIWFSIAGLLYSKDVKEGPDNK